MTTRGKSRATLGTGRAARRPKRLPLQDSTACHPAFAGFDVDFGQAVFNAIMDTDVGQHDPSGEAAKNDFCQHWPGTLHAIRGILETHRGSLTNVVLEQVEELLKLIRSTLGKDSPSQREGGMFVFNVAQAFCKDIAMGLAKDPQPPAWLKELAATEFIVPALMINGKLTSVFKDWNRTLRWGHSVVKQGKSQFDTPQTMAVASAIRIIETERRYALLVLSYSRHAPKFRMAPEDRKRHTARAALQPLSQKSKAQWWPVVRDTVRHSVTLTSKEREQLAGSTAFKTESGILNEYVKRCKAAFNCLCPRE